MLEKPDPTTLYSPKYERKVSGNLKSNKSAVLTPKNNKGLSSSVFSYSTRDRSLGKVNSAESRIKRTFKHSPNKAKIMEIMANDVKADGINRAINKSLENSAKWIESLKKDKEQISDCLYLNSFKNEGEPPNFNELDQASLTRTQMNELLIDKKELTSSAKPTYELSPMKLKGRFDKEEKKDGNSVSKSKTLQLDNIKNDLQKFTSEQKTQTEYLKVVVLALDSKLKGLLNVEKDNEILRMELEKSEEMRTDLEKALRDSNNQAKLDQMGNQTLFNKIMEDKHAVDEKLKEFSKNFEKMRNQSPSVSIENELREAKINLRNFE